MKPDIRLLGIILCLAPASCGMRTGDSRSSDLAENAIPAVKPYEVSVMELRRGIFNRETVCNGCLEAIRKVDIVAEGYGRIESVNVGEGDHVKRGDLIASTDRIQAAISLRRARLEYDRAVVSMSERLLDYGYSLSDTGMVSPSQMKLIRMMSGLTDAEIGLEQAESGFGNCEIRAPFSGVIANLECREYEPAGKRICTLIDGNRYKVRFNILETEYSLIEKGGVVSVIPFYDSSVALDGRIVSINPLVGQNGQISVCAEVPGTPQLLDGMNVRVILRKSVPDMFVIPKNAVVSRDGRDVVFLFREGRSVWTYVNILMGNGSEYAVEADKSRDAVLREGDLVIVDGNYNLGDNTVVVLND